MNNVLLLLKINFTWLFVTFHWRPVFYQQTFLYTDHLHLPLFGSSPSKTNHRGHRTWSISCSHSSHIRTPHICPVPRPRLHVRPCSSSRRPCPGHHVRPCPNCSNRPCTSSSRCRLPYSSQIWVFLRRPGKLTIKETYFCIFRLKEHILHIKVNSKFCLFSSIICPKL